MLFSVLPGHAPALALRHIAVLAEALTLGMAQEVTPAKFVEVISKCAGTSWMLEVTARLAILIWGLDTPRVTEAQVLAGVTRLDGERGG